jgi:hypothetical protein
MLAYQTELLQTDTVSAIVNVEPVEAGFGLVYLAFSVIVVARSPNRARTADEPVASCLVIILLIYVYGVKMI